MERQKTFLIFQVKQTFGEMMLSLAQLKFERNQLLNEFQDQHGLILKENKVIKNEVMEQAAQLYLLKEKQQKQAKVLGKLIQLSKNYEFKLKGIEEEKSENNNSSEEE
jgi:hypothetical protein